MPAATDMSWPCPLTTPNREFTRCFCFLTPFAADMIDSRTNGERRTVGRKTKPSSKERLCSGIKMGRLRGKNEMLRLILSGNSS
jgi:hypothetical protein